MLLLLAQSIIIICNDAQVYNPTASCFAQSKSHVTFDVNYVLYRKAEVYTKDGSPVHVPQVHGLPPADHP